MASRREPGKKEYNPLDDARGRLPIETDLIRAVTSHVPVVDTPAPEPRPPKEQSHLQMIGAAESPAPAPAPAPLTGEKPEPARPPARSFALEKLTAYNKFLTTPTEKLELDRLAARVSGALGFSVKSSQLIRACLVLMLRAENQLIRRAELQPRFKRPSNTEAVALAEFDQVLAEILSQGFRDAGPFKAKV